MLTIVTKLAYDEAASHSRLRPQIDVKHMGDYILLMV